MGGGVVAGDGPPSALQVCPVRRSGGSQLGNLPRGLRRAAHPLYLFCPFPQRSLAGARLRLNLSVLEVTYQGIPEVKDNSFF